MKYILLLLILAVSCGKNIEPKAQDLGDDDGDTIPNPRDTNPIISNLPEAGLVQGKMKLFLNPKTIELDISNKMNLEKSTFDLLTKAHLKSFSHKHQLDWANLSHTKTELPVLSEENYKVEFRFNTSSSSPSHLCYEENGAKKNLHRWGNFMEVVLTREQIEKIMSGLGKFCLGRKFETSASQRSSDEIDAYLKKSTYEVYFYDGEKSRIMNVSHKFSWPRLLKTLKAERTISINRTDLFFSSTTEDENWWYRKINDRTYVLVKTTIAKLKENFLNGFSNTKFHLVRKNGTRSYQNEIALSQPNAIHFLRVRPKRILRTFSIRKKEIRHGSGGGREGDSNRWVCEQTWREIAQRNVSEVNLDTLNNNLVLHFDKKSYRLDSLDPKIEEKEDSRGIYWDIGFKSPGHNVKLGIISLPEHTFKKTGLIKLKCTNNGYSENKVESFRTNQEEELSLNIESFIEKSE
jgi:hypothetical protein